MASPYLRLRQICLVAPELGPAEAALRNILGLDVCHRDPAVAAYGLENALFVCGNAFIEIVAPTRADTAVGRFIERGGGIDAAGGYMAIFDCDDPQARRAHALGMNVRVALDIQHDDYVGVQLHPRDGRATMLSLDRSIGGDALGEHYAPAGPHWRAAQRLDRVAALPLIELRSPDPQGLAAHWSALLQTPLTRDDHGQPLLRFDLGAARFVAAEGAGDVAGAGPAEQLSAIYLQVPDPAAALAAAQQAGCALDGSGFRFGGVRIEPCSYSLAP